MNIQERKRDRDRKYEKTRLLRYKEQERCLIIDISVRLRILLQWNFFNVWIYEQLYESSYICAISLVIVIYYQMKYGVTILHFI